MAELREVLLCGVRQADLSDVELAVTSEYYGLSSYPARLSGGDSLVGRVVTPAEGRRPKVAGRSTVAEVLRVATAKVNSAVSLPAGFVLPTGPEPDPISRSWVLAPPALGRRLPGSELALLCRSGYECSLDWVCRSQHADQLAEALRRWAEVNAGLRFSNSSSFGSSAVRLEPERRNTAHGILAICLWEIVHDEQLLAAALHGDPVVAWSGVEMLPTGGRIADQSSWGVMTSDLSADQFILLADDVLELREKDGRAAELILDVVRSGRHRQLFDNPSTVETLLWAMGYGLAAQDSWRVVELARYFHRWQPRSLTDASLMAFSGHVASLHGHDGLAWRLATGAERLVERANVGNTQQHQRRSVLWQTQMIRSGCRVREAYRWREQQSWLDAKRTLQEALELLRRAEQVVVGSASFSKRVVIDLRRAEILWAAHLLRVAGHPAKGFVDELRAFDRLLSRVESGLGVGGGEAGGGVDHQVGSDDDGDGDDGGGGDLGLDAADYSILLDRVGWLRTEYLDFLDDPPPGFPTG